MEDGPRERFASCGLWKNSALTLVSQRLSAAPMMAGDEFSAADVSIVYALELADRLGLADHFGQELLDYRNRVSSRPAYRAARAKSQPPPS